MRGEPLDTHDTALLDYLDALLQPPPQADEAPHADPSPAWWLCTLGRLQLLLPGSAFEAPVDGASLPEVPADWHLARVHLAAGTRQVAELARSIAPGLPTAAADTLLPVAGSDWMLAVPGPLQPISLSDEAIQWRPQRSSRPWLAGMSCDKRYMALDVHALLADLASADSTMEEPSP